MGWLSRLLGSDKAIDNVLDKENGLLARAGEWAGNLNYTEEEKAEANERTREWGLKQLDALAPFKVVQRILAFSVASMWLFCGLNYLLGIWVETFFNQRLDEGERAIDLITPLSQFVFSDYVLYPTLAVFSLYFSGGVIGSFRDKKS